MSYSVRVWLVLAVGLSFLVSSFEAYAGGSPFKKCPAGTHEASGRCVK